MPTTNVVANEDGSFTVTVTVPAPAPAAVPSQIVDVTAGESVEVVNTDTPPAAPPATT
jgi:hypothetical protein